MSLLGLLSAKEQDAGPAGPLSPSTEFGDVFEASAEARLRNYNILSKPMFTGIESRRNASRYQELTGKDLYAAAFDDAPNTAELNQAYRDNQPQKYVPAVDAHITRMRALNPEKYKDLKTSLEINDVVKQKAKDSLVAQSKAEAGATGPAALFGQLSGDLAASALDPVQLAMLPFGAGEAASVLKAGLVAAGANAATEVASYPAVQQWQKELGQEYGLGTLAENAAIAGTFGLVLGAGGHAISRFLHPPNSLKLAELREHFSEHPEIQEALRHEERRLQIDEANPSTYNEEIDPGTHQRGLEEADAAVNEARPVDQEKIGITDDQIRNMDTSKMDDGTKEVHDLLSEPSPEPKEPKRGTNEIFETPAEDPTPLETHEKLTEQYDSPEMHAQEKLDFEEQTKDLDPDHAVYLEGEKEPVSFEDLKKMLKDDDEFISAISSCGIGGGE